jgi:hypothetical protein
MNDIEIEWSDGDYTETCWSCFYVNFNLNFKVFLRQFNCASVGK